MKYILVGGLIFCFSGLQAQGLSEAWLGKWQGRCDIWSFNKITMSFPMSLEISPIDSGYTFTINYLADTTKPDIRKYSLIELDDSTGHYAIDEHNSIILDSYLNGECLFTSFGGLGSELLTRICLENGEMEYEITSVKSAPIRSSGNEVVGTDTIPEINSYQLHQLMKARLQK